MTNRFERDELERTQREYLEAEAKEHKKITTQHKFWQFWKWTKKEALLWFLIIAILRMLYRIIF